MHGYGQKGWVQRISNLVFVLVPDTAPEPDVIQRARVACRLAHGKKLIPIYPPLYYYPFLTQEEMSRQLARLSRKWLRRASRIWVFFPFDNEDTWRLDSFSHEILAANQGPHRQERLPVCLLHQVGESYVPVAMDRAEVNDLLMGNATAGLAGVGI